MISTVFEPGCCEFGCVQVSILQELWNNEVLSYLEAECSYYLFDSPPFLLSGILGAVFYPLLFLERAHLAQGA